MQTQVTKGAAASHSLTVFVDGAETDLDSEPTYAVTDAVGTAVTSGTATRDSVGEYSFVLPAQSNVAELTVNWSGLLSASPWSAVSSIEVIGHTLFSIDDLRGHRGGDLTSTTSYTLATLAEIRSSITDEFERICGVSFVPRYQLDKRPGSGDIILEVKRPLISEVLSVSIDDVEIDASTIRPHHVGPWLYRASGYWPKWRGSTTGPENVTVGYEHGHAQVPLEIQRAAIILAHHRAIRDVDGTGVPAHASTWTDGAGSWTAFAPNRDSMRWYGLPEVDSVLRSHRLLTGAF